MRNRNLLIITKQLHFGGTEKVIMSICSRLRDKINIVVVSSGGVYEKELRKLGIPHYKIPNTDYKSPLNLIKTIKTIKKVVEKHNINLIHSHHRMTSFYCKIYNMLFKRIPIIATFHNTFYGNKKLFTVQNDLNIPVGSDVQNYLIKYCKFKSSRVKVIYNGIAEPCNLKKLPELQKKNKLTISNIGRLEEQKGMEFFIKAIPYIMKSNINASFFIAGDGILRKKLEKLAVELNVNQYITFLGFRTDIFNIIHSSDFIVLSSLWEGFPLTPIEAFAAKKTIVATDIGGTREIVKNNYNGLLIPSKNAKALADSIIKMAKNPKLRKKLEKNAYHDFKTKYSEEIMVNKYLEVYKKLAK